MKLIRNLIRFVFRIALWFIGLSLLLVLVFRFVPVPVTVFMIYKWVEAPQDQEQHFDKDWVPLSEISPHLIQAVIASEDQKFPEHFGFDWEALQDAYQENKTGASVRGGSTITQQTAKNMFLWPGKNYFRKGLEGYFTVLFELFWSKERIMEVYLNIVEFGPGVYGAQAAAEKYFHKDAIDLNRYECALMATSLPNPVKYSLAHPGPYMKRRQQWVLRNMNNLGKIEL